MYHQSRPFIVLAVILLSVAVLIACTDNINFVEETYYYGETLTPEMVESIYAALSAAVTEKYPTETDASGKLVVYWTVGGSVYHVSSACGSIKKLEPTEIHSGTVKDALRVGKEKACSVCSKEEK